MFSSCSLIFIISDRGSFPKYEVEPSLLGYDSRPLILQYAEQKYVSIF